MPSIHLYICPLGVSVVGAAVGGGIVVGSGVGFSIIESMVGDSIGGSVLSLASSPFPFFVSQDTKNIIVNATANANNIGIRQPSVCLPCPL